MPIASQKINPCLWFDTEAELACEVLLFRVQEFEDEQGQPLCG
jgi:predicted 3-demethylubiquinone-9 3-methyltransferase (glyoxalase superfamily)